MTRPNIVILGVIISLLLTLSVLGQQASNSLTLFVNYSNDVQSRITFYSPREFTNEETRGLAQKDTEFIEIEGIVQDKDGVDSLFLNNQWVETGIDGYFVTNVQLKDGVNTFAFKVIDSEQSITHIVRRIKKVERTEVLPNSGEYYALIMGVQNYDDSNFGNLDYPINDAKALHDILSIQYSFKPENINMMLDPTREDMVNALDELSLKVTSEDNLLIFFAGHGYWYEESRIGFWLPKDAKKGKRAAWFRNSSLRDYIQEINSKHTLLIADACFSGAIFKSRSVLPDASIATTKLYNLTSRKAMTSGGLTTVPDRSVFMEYLLKSLRENHQLYMSSGELFSKFRLAVMNNSNSTPLYGTVQNTGDEGGEFVFVRKEGE